MTTDHLPPRPEKEDLEIGTYPARLVESHRGNYGGFRTPIGDVKFDEDTNWTAGVTCAINGRMLYISTEGRHYHLDLSDALDQALIAIFERHHPAPAAATATEAAP